MVAEKSLFPAGTAAQWRLGSVMFGAMWSAMVLMAHHSTTMVIPGVVGAVLSFAASYLIQRYEPQKP